MNSTIRLFTLLAFAFALIARSSSAQVDRASLEGTVTDPTGAIVRGATVRIVAVETGLTQERTANANGYYRFPGIAIGEYTVTAAASGFKTKVIEEVSLRVGETRTLDVKLEIGQLSDKVEVTAEDDPAERSSAESSAVIGELQIQDTPLNGRNWASLTRLAPWAQDDGGGDQRTIRFAGRARDDNNFSYDGVDATGIQEQAQKAEVRLQVSPDAIAEYRVSSAMYDAEYGKQSGGQVDVVTKSGTNDFHGSVFGYFRNSAFDARNFNDFDVNGNPYLPPFRMGQYGGTFGGPIKQNKMFFFLSYEGLRQYGGVTLVAAVPDLAVQQATLSGPQGTNMCPILQAYPWRKSSVSALSQYGCAPKFVYPDTAFAANPCPDPTNCLGTEYDNFTHPGQSMIHEDTWLTRFDYNISPKALFYARAQRDIAFASSPTGNLFDNVGTNNHPANYILALQTQLSTTFLNEFKFGLNRAPFHNPVYPGLIDIGLSSANFESLNNSQTDNEVGTTFSYVDNATWTRGPHAVKFGIDVMRVRLNQGKTESLTASYTGDNTSFISNSLDSAEYTTSWAGHALRRTFVMPYIQDEWKARRDLTLNLGLRWEYYAPITEAHNRVKIFDLTACHGFCPPTDALEYPNYKNFDPRFSLAWAPSRFGGKTVVRGGFGIYHGAAQNDDRNAALESDRTDTKYSASNCSQLSFGPGYLQKPPNFNVPASCGQGQIKARALIRHHPDLYVETWGLSVQQALPQNFLFTVSYLGTHGVHLFARNYENICDPVALHPPNSPIGPCNRPLDNYPVLNPDGSVYGYFGTIDLKYNVGTSSYNGLMFALDRQLTQGLAFNAKYTFAHSINTNTVGGGESSAPQNAACIQCEKGPSIYDVRHNVILSFAYDFPFGPGKRYVTDGFASRLLRGWTATGLWNWHTGHPLTVYLSPSDPTLLPDGNDGSSPRPDVAPGVSVVPKGQNSNNWVNPAAFITPPADASGSLLRYGNAGNGLVRSPNVWQVDFGMQRQVKLTERLNLLFGAQFFNIFNHVQLADPRSLSFDYNCNLPTYPATCTFSPHSNFGVINTLVNSNINSDKFFADNTGTGLARQLQLFVRFEF